MTTLINKIEKYPLHDYNSVNVVYNIPHNELNDLLIKLKTLLSIDFKLLKVIKHYDASNSIYAIKKNTINSNIQINATNIFHTYEEGTGFISYEKYKFKILDIISRDINNVVTIEQNIVIPICESYNFQNSTHYLEYLFELENNISISCQTQLNNNNTNIILSIPFMEDKYISTEKKEYVDKIYNMLTTIMSD